MPGAVQISPDSKLVAWLKLNLGLTIGIITLISGAVGFLVATTVRVTTVQIMIEDSAKRVHVLEGNIVDVDKRLNDIVNKERQVQDDFDRRIAELHERAEVLRTALAYVGERTPPTPIDALTGKDPNRK